MPESSLLIGNGPNRLTNSEHSWAAVLTNLADSSDQPSVIAGSTERPFTLIFEELALRCARRGQSENYLKQLVASRVDLMQPNDVHRQLLELDVRHIITTNYDYTLERSSHREPECADIHTESRYSLFRRQTCRGKQVWHAHGEVNKPPTLLLGHDQYVGYLHKARNYLTTLHARERSSKYDYRSPVLHGEYQFDISGRGDYSWLDVFLRDDIHVAGFGMAYSEIGMWWLVGYKERLRLRDSRLPKLSNVGQTIYYYFADEENAEPLRGQLQVLHDLGVKLVRIELDGCYERGWDNMVRQLRRATAA